MWRQYINYFFYLLRHKWLVVVAGFKLGVPIAQLIFHDLSKCFGVERVGYSCAYYSRKGVSQCFPTEEYKKARDHHYTNSKHHWKFWCVDVVKGNVYDFNYRVMGLHSGIEAKNGYILAKIPSKYLKEMVADLMVVCSAKEQLVLPCIEGFKLHSETRKELLCLIKKVLGG